MTSTQTSDPTIPLPATLPALPPSNLASSDLIPLSRFSPPELAQVRNIAKGIDWTDGASILAQMNAPNAKFADAITKQLEGVAVYETGAAAGLILELSRQIKSTNLAQMRKESKGEDWVAANFGSLPVIGKHVSAIRHFQLNHKTVVGEINRLRDRANAELLRLRGVHQQLEAQEKATETVLREMMVHIAACEMALHEARPRFEADRQQLTSDADPFKIQKLRDFGDNITMLETRLINAKTSFVEKMLAIPDIRARQVAARIEISNTIDSIQNDLPDLCSAIARLVASYNIGEAQKGTALRKEIRRELGKATADSLDDVYLAAKRSQSGAQDEIDALATRVERLMTTLQRGAEIDAANVKSREESNQKLVELRDAVITGLAASARGAITAG